MKINSLNNQTTFGRVITINSMSNYLDNRISKDVDKSTLEIQKVLNRKKSNIYSKEEAKSIKDFFKTCLGDYSRRNGVLFKQISGDIILLSGQDSKDIKKMEENLPSEKKLRQEMKHKINSEIIKRLENGKNSKALSSIDLYSTTTSENEISNAKQKGIQLKDMKFDNFSYHLLDYDYTQIRDGALKSDTNPHKRYSKEFNIKNAICEERHLSLN